MRGDSNLKKLKPHKLHEYFMKVLELVSKTYVWRKSCGAEIFGGSVRKKMGERKHLRHSKNEHDTMITEKKSDSMNLIFQQQSNCCNVQPSNHPSGVGSFLFLKATRLGTLRKAMLSLEDLELEGWAPVFNGVKTWFP